MGLMFSSKTFFVLIKADVELIMACPIDLVEILVN